MGSLKSAAHPVSGDAAVADGSGFGDASLGAGAGSGAGVFTPKPLPAPRPAPSVLPPDPISPSLLGDLSSGDLALRGPVGPGAANHPDDVFKVESVLSQSDTLKRPPGRAFGDDTLTAIKTAQTRLNDDTRLDLGRSPLNPDGLVNPDGPTAKATRTLARNVIESGRAAPKGAETLEETARRFADGGPITDTPAVPKPLPAIRDPLARMTGDDVPALHRLAQGLSKTTHPGPVAGDIADAFRAEPKRAAAEFALIRDRLSETGTAEQVENLDAAVLGEMSAQERERFDDLLRSEHEDFLLRPGDEDRPRTMEFRAERDGDPRNNVLFADGGARDSGAKDGGDGPPGGAGDTGFVPPVERNSGKSPPTNDRNLGKIYANHGVDPDTAQTLANTGVDPQIDPEFHPDRTKLIGDILNVDVKDGEAVKNVRQEIAKTLSGDMGGMAQFQDQLTRRVRSGGQDGTTNEGVLEALAPKAVKRFGRDIDPENAKLLADVINARPETRFDVQRAVNKRFGGLSGDAQVFNQMAEQVVRYRESGGKVGQSPKQAAERLMPYVDGRKAGTGKLAIKALATSATAVPGTIARLIEVIDLADSVRTLHGTGKQRKNAAKTIMKK